MRPRPVVFQGGKKSPDASLSSKEYLKKYPIIPRKITTAVKSYGKNVAGGAKIVSGAVKRKVLKAFKG